MVGVALLPAERTDATPPEVWVIPNPDAYAIQCDSYEYDLSKAEVEICEATDHTTIVAHIMHEARMLKGTIIRVPIMSTVKSLPSGSYMLRMRVVDSTGEVTSPWSQWIMAKKDW